MDVINDEIIERQSSANTLITQMRILFISRHNIVHPHGLRPRGMPRLHPAKGPAAYARRSSPIDMTLETKLISKSATNINHKIFRRYIYLVLGRIGIATRLYRNLVYLQKSNLFNYYYIYHNSILLLCILYLNRKF